MAGSNGKSPTPLEREMSYRVQRFDAEWDIAAVVSRTAFNRDLVALLRAAEQFDEQAWAFHQKHDSGTLAAELIELGAITREQHADRAVMEKVERSADIVDDTYGFLWALGMFISAMEGCACQVRDDEALAGAGDVTPSAIVGGKDGA